MSHSLNALLSAASLDDPNTLRALLDAGADPNGSGDDPDGLTPLHVAALWGRLGAIEALLDAGANPKAKTSAHVARIVRRDKRVMRPASGTFFLPKPREVLPEGAALDKGSAAVHAAASVGAVDCFARLAQAERRGASMRRDGCGATALHLAALGGHRALFEHLGALPDKHINAGTRVRKSLRFYDTGMTPLHAALEAGDAWLVRALLERGADPLARTKIGCNAVFFAARGGSVEALDAVVALGARADEPSAFMNYPLVEAIEAGHLAMVRRLLELGAPTEAEGGHQAPLYTATKMWSVELREALLSAGARPLPFHGPNSAARNNHVQQLADYADQGGDLNVVRYNCTPLMSAVVEGHAASVALLLERGADVNACTSIGTALHLALDRKRPEVTAMLLDAQPDVNLTDAHGNVPLWSVVGNPANAAFVEPLMRLGADPDVRNNRGVSPREFAARHGRADMFDIA